MLSGSFVICGPTCGRITVFFFSSSILSCSNAFFFSIASATAVSILRCVMIPSLVALAFYPVTKEMHLDTLKKIEEEKQKNFLITTDGEVTAQVAPDAVDI